VTALGRLYAHVYDAAAQREDRRGAAALRELLVADAEGDVLEIGTGTGRCLPHYRKATRVVALEPDDGMRAIAERRVAARGLTVEVLDGDAMALPFPDDSFDTIVAAWVLCTIPDPRRALVEACRVLRPGGTVRFCEHVRSENRRLAARQDLLARPWRWVARGCRCNQDTVGVLQDVGFQISALALFDFEPSSPRIVRPTALGVACPHSPRR
jgi:ubiquinone/menaquinone biosynthesis C-methylase UbiE